MSYDFLLECGIILNAYMFDVKIFGPLGELIFMIFFSMCAYIYVSSSLLVSSHSPIAYTVIGLMLVVGCWLQCSRPFMDSGFALIHTFASIRPPLRHAHIKRAIALLLFTFLFPLISFPCIFMGIHEFVGYLGTSRVTKPFIQP